MSAWLDEWNSARRAWDANAERETAAEVKAIADLLAASLQATARAWQRYNASEKGEADRARRDAKLATIQGLMSDTSAKGRAANAWYLSIMLG